MKTNKIEKKKKTNHFEPTIHVDYEWNNNKREKNVHSLPFWLNAMDLCMGVCKCEYEPFTIL